MSVVLELPFAPPPAPHLGRIPSGGSTVSAERINTAISGLLTKSKASTQRNWRGAVAKLVCDLRPDLRDQLLEHLGVEPQDIGSPLEGMSVGEIGLVYEAVTALTDHQSRRTHGQYFTPDDVARYMASQAVRFPAGAWLDPCCGVGNLSWHLAYAMDDPEEFVADRLTLVDLDPVALQTASALLIACFARHNDFDALPKLLARSRRRSFLAPAALPEHDFVIVNPPYAATERVARFRTADARDLYAYFLERIIATSSGFIAITPASHLGATKYASLRKILEELPGGDVLVFDNVPDTCFRGFKYGSTNTSKTNFVRAAITVSAPADTQWKVTPILRWAAGSRERMWLGARDKLVPLRKGPAGEWAKVMPGTEPVWDALVSAERHLGDLISAAPTGHVLRVASTPRYYISASKRELDRGSVHTLYFRTQVDLDLAYVLLNSSLPYWWWRCLDGGITLPKRILLSLPLPPNLRPSQEIAGALERSEQTDVVTKLNAGRHNENVRRPRALVDEIDRAVLAGLDYDFRPVYAPDMFEPAQPLTAELG